MSKYEEPIRLPKPRKPKGTGPLLPEETLTRLGAKAEYNRLPFSKDGDTVQPGPQTFDTSYYAGAKEGLTHWMDRPHHCQTWRYNIRYERDPQVDNSSAVRVSRADNGCYIIIGKIVVYGVVFAFSVAVTLIVLFVLSR